MRVAVLANLKQNAPTWEGMPADQWDDLDGPKTIHALVAALESSGHEARFLEARLDPPHSLIERLREFQPDLCFNIAESHFGDGREAQIPALLEMLRIPYTGSRVLTLALALDKPLTKRILLQHGLPTPEFQVFERADEPLAPALASADGSLRFPLFVKPSREGTSIGVGPTSIARTVEALRAEVADQLRRYAQPILVEHYIAGREVTVGLVGNFQPGGARGEDHSLPEGITFLPPMEVDFSVFDPSAAGIYTNLIKTDFAETMTYVCPAPLEPELQQRLFWLAAEVFRATDCKDIARVDFRLDASQGDAPYILEINPLPGLNPVYSDLCIQARAAQWPYENLINRVVELAAARYGLRVGQPA